MRFEYKCIFLIKHILKCYYHIQFVFQRIHVMVLNMFYLPLCTYNNGSNNVYITIDQTQYHYHRNKIQKKRMIS